MRVLVASLSNLGYFAEYLARRGHEAALYQPRRVDLGDFRQEPIEAGSSRLVLAPVWPRRPYPYSRFLSAFVPLLRDFRPDVVYLVGEPSELAVAQLARLTRRYSPQTRLVGFSFENVDRQWHGFPRSLRARAERETLSRLDLIVAATNTAREHLIRRGFPAERLRVVHLGLDPDFYAGRDGLPVRAQLGLMSDDFLIGFVGRLVPEKGADVLLQALAQLPASHRLLLIGSGRAEAELRGLATDLGVEERVHWAGRLSREEVANHLAACQALVLPSRSIPQWQEQFGLVLAEAMLSGVPVVGSSSGAIPEVIGEAGLVFPEGEAPALAECLRRLQTDPALGEELRRKGKERARHHFSEESFLGGIAAAIEEATTLPPRPV